MVRKGDMFVIGHRGAPALAPENTLPSFMKAIELGVDYVEFDVRASSDGELVIIHDEAVNRTTDSKGLVSSYTSASLRKLDAGGWFGEEFRNVRIPTIDEVLRLMKDKTSAVIHIKHEGIEDEVLNAVRKYDMIHRCIIMAPLTVSKRIKLSEPIIPIQADLPEINPRDAIDMLARNLVDIASIHISNLNKNLVKLCHRSGLLVNVWDVDRPEQVEKCKECEVEFVTTNDPKTVLETLRNLQSKD